jgi:hypothetical protein
MAIATLALSFVLSPSDKIIPNFFLLIRMFEKRYGMMDIFNLLKIQRP